MQKILSEQGRSGWINFVENIYHTRIELPFPTLYKALSKSTR